MGRRKAGGSSCDKAIRIVSKEQTSKYGAEPKTNAYSSIRLARHSFLSDTKWEGTLEIESLKEGVRNVIQQPFF